MSRLSKEDAERIVQSMRNWFLESEDRYIPDNCLDDLTVIELLREINKAYKGGVKQFIADNQC